MSFKYLGVTLDILKYIFIHQCIHCHNMFLLLYRFAGLLLSTLSWRFSLPFNFTILMYNIQLKKFSVDQICFYFVLQCLNAEQLISNISHVAYSTHIN